MERDNHWDDERKRSWPSSPYAARSSGPDSRNGRSSSSGRAIAIRKDDEHNKRRRLPQHHQGAGNHTIGQLRVALWMTGASETAAAASEKTAARRVARTNETSERNNPDPPEASTATGRTNDSAIDIADSSDDDEIEVLLVQPFKETHSNLPLQGNHRARTTMGPNAAVKHEPRHALSANRATARSFRVPPGQRLLGASHAPLSSNGGSKFSSQQNRHCAAAIKPDVNLSDPRTTLNGRAKDPPAHKRPPRVNCTNGSGSAALPAPRRKPAPAAPARLEGGQEHNPIIVDTDEDFANMEKEAEVITIEDSDDDDDDDEDDNSDDEAFVQAARTKAREARQRSLARSASLPSQKHVGAADRRERRTSMVHYKDRRLVRDQMRDQMLAPPPKNPDKIYRERSSQDSPPPTQGGVCGARSKVKQEATENTASNGSSSSSNPKKIVVYMDSSSEEDEVDEVQVIEQPRKQKSRKRESYAKVKGGSRSRAVSRGAASPKREELDLGAPTRDRSGIPGSCGGSPASDKKLPGRKQVQERYAGARSHGQRDDGTTEAEDDLGDLCDAVAHMPSGECTKEVKRSQRLFDDQSEGGASICSSRGTEDTAEVDEGYRKHAVSLFFRERSKPYSLNAFLDLWRQAEHFIGITEVIEKGKGFRKELKKENEQYGRVLPGGMKKVFKGVGLRRDSCYLDIGHGIGNTCLQAAYTVGCDAKGIECNTHRCAVADAFDLEFKSMAGVHRGRDGSKFLPGRVELRKGELQDKKHREWLIRDTDVAFVNNFGDVFSDVRGGIHLDRHVAALFALMKEGAVMATMSSLYTSMGCLDLTKANAKRRTHGLPESENASFYHYRRINVGKQRHVASWSEWGGCDDDVIVHVYTRTKQSDPSLGAVFLCNNPDCAQAQDMVPIPAVEFEGKGGAPCIATCNCGISDRSARARTKATRYVPEA